MKGKGAEIQQQGPFPFRKQANAGQKIDASLILYNCPPASRCGRLFLKKLTDAKNKKLPDLRQTRKKCIAEPLSGFLIVGDCRRGLFPALYCHKHRRQLKSDQNAAVLIA